MLSCAIQCNENSANLHGILMSTCLLFPYPSKSEASLLRQMISDTQAFPVSHYTPSFNLENGATAAQVMVMGPDDHIVSIMRYALLALITPAHF